MPLCYREAGRAFTRNKNQSRGLRVLALCGTYVPHGILQTITGKVVYYSQQAFFLKLVTHHHGLLVEALVGVVAPGAPRRARRLEADALHVEGADGREAHGARQAQQEHAHGEQLLGVEGA